MRITDIIDLKPIYDYQMGLSAPYFFPVDFESWKAAFLQDIDGEGRKLFRNLHTKAACDGEKLLGFVQYGNTAFGFDSRGEITPNISYQVIRSLYFDEGQETAGRLLLEEALSGFAGTEKVYAFFHYFGMNCFARHGKLFQGFDWIKELLQNHGFRVEHENVYYSARLQSIAHSEVEVVPHSLTSGNQQTFDFIYREKQVGGCEVHYLDTKGIAYLRWIYVNDEVQNQGVGTACMLALKKWLQTRAITQLDTDTAANNHRARHYYEKNGFTRAGITESFYRMPR